VIYNGDFYWGRGIAVSDNHLYVSIYYEGLVVFDISDPHNPVQTGSCDALCSNLVIVGDLVYSAAFEEGLKVVDVSDLTNPYVSGFADIPGIAFDVAVAGNYAYVTSTEAGLQVVYIGE
jgi:hypothetical protein